MEKIMENIISFQTKNGVIDLDFRKNIVFYGGNPLSNFNDSVASGYDYKTDSPKTLKIILGHGCNYKCGYCLQDDISTKKNFKKTDLLSQLTSSLNLNQIDEIDLWGGEPLLYFEEMQEIMNALDRPNLTWSMVTNGSLLTKEILDYFESLKGNVALGISHDAKKQIELRGKEFITKKTDIFERIDKSKNVSYMFTTTVTNFNFDFFEINQFFIDFFDFYGLKRRKLNFQLVEGYESKSAKYVVQGENLSKFSTITSDFIDVNIKAMLSKENKFLLNNIVHDFNDIKSVMGYLSFLKNPIHLNTNVKCDMDKNDTLTVDTNGKVRSCQNGGEEYILGSVTNLKDIKLKESWLSENDKCSTCKVNTLCKGGCPYIKKSSLFELNCAQHFTFYSIIQQKAIELLGSWQ